MSNIFGSPKRFREDDWWHKRDPERKLIDDLQFRPDHLLDEEPVFKKSSQTFSSTTSSQSSSTHSSTVTNGNRNGNETKPQEVNDEKEFFEEKDQFVIKVDVSKFPPEKVQVKVSNNTVLIDAVHDDKTDEHNFVTRTLARKFVLPKDVDMQTVVSRLTERGVLTICAPKKGIPKGQERVIPVKLV